MSDAVAIPTSPLPQTGLTTRTANASSAGGDTGKTAAFARMLDTTLAAPSPASRAASDNAPAPRQADRPAAARDDTRGATQASDTTTDNAATKDVPPATATAAAAEGKAKPARSSGDIASGEADTATGDTDASGSSDDATDATAAAAAAATPVVPTLGTALDQAAVLALAATPVPVPATPQADGAKAAAAETAAAPVGGPQSGAPSPLVLNAEGVATPVTPQPETAGKGVTPEMAVHTASGQGAGAASATSFDTPATSASAPANGAAQPLAPQGATPSETKPQHEAAKASTLAKADEALGQTPQAAAQHGKPTKTAQADTAKPSDAPAQTPVTAAGNAPQPLPQTTTVANAQTPANAAMPAPPQTVNTGAIAVTIATRAAGGNTHFDIKLDPPELGKIDVRLQLDHEGKVKSTIVVEKQETYELLQRDPRSLERALQQAGVKTADNGVAFQMRDPGSNASSQQQSSAFAGRDGQQGQNGGRGWTQYVPDDQASAPVDPAVLRQAYAAARRGGVDVRI